MNQDELLIRIEQAADKKETHLDLSGKGITSLPPEIGQLTDLTSLDLSNNKLTNVPNQLGLLANLTTLDLSRNELESIPTEIGKLTNLKKLDLRRNQLTSIPAELGKLINLENLDLSYNQLTSIPVELGSLTCLKLFWLLHNQLKNIPHELGRLTNLVSLHLSNNQLRSIPKELGELINLIELGLHVNQLTSVPAELGELKHLEHLDLYDNRLTIIPAELGNLKKLDSLNLLRNKDLKSPPPEVVNKGTKAILAYLRGDSQQSDDGLAQEDVDSIKKKDGDRVLETVSIAGFSASDQRAETDTLGFEPYTKAIVAFLSHKDTEPPLTISVEGEWGSGKSSFMLQLMKKLESPGVHTVEFSPWRHDKEEAVWAAFVLAFINKLSEDLGWFEALKANLKLLWKRFNWQAGWPDIGKIIVKLFVYLLILSTFLVAFWVAKIPHIQSIDFSVKLLLSFASIGVVVVKGLEKAKELVGNPFEHDLKKYVEAPDYAGRIPFVERFHKDFNKIVKAYAGNKTIYVFIDDLDRCEVPKAAELMKAINLMITEEPNLIFIIGMDRQKVAAGLAVKDKDLIHYLRPELTEQKKDEVVGSFWLAGLRYGYDFIEKFIQLPFTLPRPTETDIDNMLASIASKGRAVTLDERAENTAREDQDSGDQAKLIDSTEIQESKPKESDTGRELKEKQEIEQKQKRQLELRLANDSEQINQIVHMAVPFVGFNPRRIKQFINIFRLRAYIAYETQLLILPEEVDQAEGVTLEQLGKIVVISLRWPLLLEALSREESLLRVLSDFAELKNRDIDTLKNEVARHWAMDDRLMELIRFGCVRGEAEPREWVTYTLSRAKIDKLLQVSPKVRNIKLAPLEISVSSAVAVSDAVGAEVVISEQQKIGKEMEDAGEHEEINEIKSAVEHKDSTEFLQQPINDDTLRMFTKKHFPDLPINEHIHGLILRDLNYSKYTKLGDIKKAVEYSKEFLEYYSTKSPDLFKAGSDYITKSLGYYDEEFLNRHSFAQQTKDAVNQFKRQEL